EWVHVQLHQQKGMISLSPPTICNSALTLKPPALPEDTYFCQTRRYIASKNNIIASKDIFIITGANS
ncbi:hypothetical protein PO485_27085, partial [Klebsiella pneumoniae]